ncbi:transposase [Blastococcus tunisiensis]|uniref:Transposase DDE domain-containing protein n=1 Tax=Blastococcus tunisiensis TaxID=1798228 RepID=A0A1I2MM26_9ACTN|nr:transposase [Blastococcus sp. DSM 46838]SFF90426.1 Transposase DDE domain-containing protein [Blastococcus sp. DSM 46838]
MVIPEPSDQIRHRKNKGSRGGRPVDFDTGDYKNRNVAERAFNHFENWRGLATRYDKHVPSTEAARSWRRSCSWLA